ncbi:MAG TPA: calcium-binding protein [Microvirga sp.]|jgi:Ca2+-binding RTX toxin-like protein|nr:calcium-binding protein [Microvirga sp.]
MGLIYGTSASETLTGTSSADTMYGTEGNDKVLGLDGDDRLYGGVDNDRLFGAGGADLLYGGEGNDKLSGGDGNDRLSGGPGRDVLTGGAGPDVFFFSRGYAGITKSTVETITDWRAKDDQIDISAAGTVSNYRESSTSAGSIKAAAAFAEATFTSDQVAHVFLYNTATDTGYLLSDTNSDGGFDTGVVLKGAGSGAGFSHDDII